jgi:hypothetical protein
MSYAATPTPPRCGRMLNQNPQSPAEGHDLYVSWDSGLSVLNGACHGMRSQYIMRS